MKTYADIKAEIAKLELQAERARKGEIAGVIARIKEAIAAYGLTAGDLGLGGGKASTHTTTTRAAGKGKLSVGVAKYRDPETGKTWTGRGKPPNWIVGAKDRTPFLIDASAAASETRRPAGRKARRADAAGGKRAKRKSAAAKRAPTPAKSPAVQMESASAQ